MAPQTTVTESTERSGTQARLSAFVSSFEGRLAVATIVAIAAHLILNAAAGGAPWWLINAPLIIVVVIGGAPLIYDVAVEIWQRKAGADLLAAISIIASVALGEWLVAAIIVLMMSGGEALETAATARASETLDALARRSPVTAHRLLGADISAGTEDVLVADIDIGDRILVLPHELVPVDGEVIDGQGTMDESFLTGEPYVVPKSIGSQVLSGAVNGESAIALVAVARAADSRYAQIVAVLRTAEDRRPPMRRLADRLGGWYTALALILGIAGWVVSGDPMRFLAVVVVATPCPLLIGVPVAIIGAISVAAKRGIIIKNPGVLEEISRVHTVVFDKTGTLTYGRPVVTEILPGPNFEAERVLQLAAAIEQYSRHPLAAAITEAAEDRELSLPAVTQIAERPGHGLSGTVDGQSIYITNREQLSTLAPDGVALLPELTTGLECVIVIDGSYAATMRFRDEPRLDAAAFIAHLPGRHGVARTMIVSGDREGEVRYLADRVGIDEVHAEISPEGKLDIVQEITRDQSTLFLGDGINDAPAMTAATVGVAFGAAHDITSEAADAVVLESSLERLDDLIHIGERMRRIALQSALGGIALSAVGMGFAVVGMLTPIAGAVLQELIDLAAILNSARVAIDKGPLADFHRKAHSG